MTTFSPAFVAAVAFLVQTGGTGFIAVMSGILARSLRRRGRDLWTWGWVAMTLSCLVRAAAFAFAAYRFPLLVIASPLATFALICFFCGVYRYVHHRLPHVPPVLWPAVLVAATLLPFAFEDAYAQGFFVEAFLGALGFGAIAAISAGAFASSRFGMRLIFISSTLLAAGLIRSVFVEFGLHWAGYELAPRYWAYNNSITMLLMLALAFGTMIASMDSVVVELEVAHEEVKRIAQTDSLTGVLNRHAFHAIAGYEMNTVSSGCLVIADINDLKIINDKYGHSAGDDAIRAVADALQKLVRPTDRVFRWGGDEFVILLMGLSEENAIARFDALRAAPITVHGADGENVIVGVSWGVAPFEHHQALDDALLAADALLYDQKALRSSPPQALA